MNNKTLKKLLLLPIFASTSFVAGYFINQIETPKTAPSFSMPSSKPSTFRPNFPKLKITPLMGLDQPQPGLSVVDGHPLAQVSYFLNGSVQASLKLFRAALSPNQFDVRAFPDPRIAALVLIPSADSAQFSLSNDKKLNAEKMLAAFRNALVVSAVDIDAETTLLTVVNFKDVESLLLKDPRAKSFENPNSLMSFVPGDTLRTEEIIIGGKSVIIEQKVTLIDPMQVEKSILEQLQVRGFYERVLSSAAKTSAILPADFIEKSGLFEKGVETSYFNLKTTSKSTGYKSSSIITLITQRPMHLSPWFHQPELKKVLAAQNNYPSKGKDL